MNELEARVENDDIDELEALFEGVTYFTVVGPKGDPGAPGKDGHSPVVTATKSGKTTTISVDGAAIATVEDGADGKPGAAGAGGITPTIGPNGNWYLGEEDTGKPSRGAIGAPGKDGHSPVVTATKSGKTTTISVDGAAIATVEDGADGAPGFRGADGITPTIGDNGNWYLGAEDTGKPSRGEKGDPGAAGKTAYQYAADGGYTGTEEEFAAKLAQEPLIGTTNELTPTQVYDAVSAGIPVKVRYFDKTFGILAYTNFSVAESMNLIGANTISYFNGGYILGELIGNTDQNKWLFLSTILAQKSDIPSALPNPNALTFTGAVTGSYDGSAAVTVNIPSAVTDAHINSLIDAKLGVIENGAY